MGTATELLIVAGVANIAYGFLLGYPLAVAVRRGTEPSKYLRNAHVGPLMQGPILLSLSLAADLASLSASLETVAASLLVAGSALLGVGDTALWLTGVTNSATARRNVGALLATASAVVAPIGLAIIFVGVLRAL